MPPQSKPHILYVDDEPRNLSVFKSSFRRKYHLHLTTSGQEALEVLKEHPIQLLITDQKMPNMTGVELLRIAVKEYPKTMRMILTGFSETEAVISAINECSIFRYLTKPWIFEEMQNSIDTALDTYRLKEDNELLVKELKEVNSSLEDKVNDQVATLKQQQEEMATLNHDLKQTNRELQKSEFRYRAIAENIPNGFIATISPSLRYTFIDGYELKQYQNTHPDEIIGKYIFEVHTAYTASKLQYFFQRALEGIKEEFELEIWGKAYAINCMPFTPYGSQTQGILAIAQNITDRKQQQLAIEQSNDFFNKIFDTLPCLLYIFDMPSSNITYINQVVEKILGYPPEHYLNVNKAQWKEYVHPKDIRALIQDLQNTQKLQHGEVAIQEYRIKHRNGHYVWLRSTATVFERADNGDVLEVLSYVEDVSRYKLVEKQRKEQSDFLSQMNMLSPNAIFVVEWPSLNIQYHNRQLVEVLGYDKGSIQSLGSDLFNSIIHPEDLSKLLQHFDSIAQNTSNKYQSIVYRVKNKFGNWRWWYESSTKFKVEANGHVQILSMAQDITELKEAEIAIQQSEERLLETQEIAKVGRWEMEVATQRVRWFGLQQQLAKLPTSADLTYFPAYIEHTHPKDAQLLLQNHERLINEGTPYEMDLSYQLNNEKTSHIHLIARPVYEKGKVIKVVGSAMDITKLKAIEDQLKRLNDSKDRILATVAHDLRSPINQIKGLIMILKIQLGSLATETANENLFTRIEDSSNKGLKLISELLEISELENNSYQLDTEPVLFDEFIQDLVDIFRNDFENASITLATKLECQGMYVELNKAKFTRVVENLLINAKKFTPEGKSVTVTTKPSPSNRLILSIADTGIGIPKDLQHIIFDKFSKAGRTGLKGEKSTGLGMSIVKSVVQLHNGHISFESDEGEGTSFFIDLPITSS